MSSIASTSFVTSYSGQKYTTHLFNSERLPIDVYQDAASTFKDIHDDTKRIKTTAVNEMQEGYNTRGKSAQMAIDINKGQKIDLYAY